MIKLLKSEIFNKQNRKYILIILAISFLIIGMIVIKCIYNDKGIIINGIQVFENNVNDKINVYIDGEVNRPGYVKLSKGATVKDAINKAEGITERADIVSIDLTRILKNKEKIIIPTIKSVLDEETVNIKQDEENNAKININTANVEELTRLKGIGEKTANKIVEYRVSNKFNKIEDIMQINGIGISKFENIKDDICV